MLLISGMLIWWSVHLLPGAAPNLRAAAIARVGLGGYKGLFSIAILSGLAMMIVGWGDASAVSIYHPPQWLRTVTVLLMWPALIMFVSGRLPADYKRVIRHPQLLGVKIWALAHLLSNGEVRSLILFGGLLFWAVAEMVLINRREDSAGPRVKPDPVGLPRTLIPIAVGTVLFGVLMHFHASFTGMPVIGTL